MHEIYRSIIIGSISEQIKDAKENEHTHTWCIFLRSAFGKAESSLKRYIKAVEFKLHHTYNQSLRVCKSPPYEVTETGWGEFDVEITIRWNDSTLAPLVAVHHIKLYKVETDPPHLLKLDLLASNDKILEFDADNSVISTQYRELIFDVDKCNPDFIKSLQQSDLKIYGEVGGPLWIKKKESEFLKLLDTASKVVGDDIKELNERMNACV